MNRTYAVGSPKPLKKGLPESPPFQEELGGIKVLGLKCVSPDENLSKSDSLIQQAQCLGVQRLSQRKPEAQDQERLPQRRNCFASPLVR